MDRDLASPTRLHGYSRAVPSLGEDKPHGQFFSSADVPPALREHKVKPAGRRRYGRWTVLCGSLTFRLDALGQSWFGVGLFHVGVIAGSTKNLAAQTTFLGVYVTDLRSAIGALRCRGSLAGIAISIFYASHQEDLAITRRRHPETLTNFFKSRADVF
jgi:hypothetical protein